MKHLIIALFFCLFLTGCGPTMSEKDIAYQNRLEYLEDRMENLEKNMWDLQSNQYMTMDRIENISNPIKREEATVFYPADIQDTAELLEDSTRLDNLETKEKLSKKEQREKMQLDYEQKERRLDQQLEILTKQNQQIDSLLKK